MRNKIAYHLSGVMGLVSIGMSLYSLYKGDKDQAIYNLVLGWMLVTGAANFRESVKK